MIKNAEKVALVIPYMGEFDREHLACVNALEGIVKVSCWGVPNLAQARSYLAQKAQDETTAKVFLWVDDDILFSREDVESIVNQCLDNYPIICGAYSLRKPGEGLTVAFNKDVTEVGFYSQGGIYPIQFCGMGFTCIHRTVMQDVGAKLPRVTIASCQNYPAKQYFEEIVLPSGQWKGEDHSFIWRAKECGYTPVVDTRLRILHRGLYNYSIEDVVKPVTPEQGFAVSLNHQK